ncbi:MAG: class I SAM-dependent methyltransferase [Proteobacteria bacterium]|nr:class I SAM-dependent methyltransferase [Burkholderiales bacterium]
MNDPGSKAARAGAEQCTPSSRRPASRPCGATRRAFLVGAVAGVSSLAVPSLGRAQFGVGDVVYVPTPQVVVNRMMTMAKVSAADFVIDLGSGDGRQLITAVSKFGAKGGRGFDLDEELLKLANANAKKEGVSDRVQFVRRNMFETDVSGASVITLYLLPELNLKLRPKLFAELRPGSRIVSHDYSMGDWQAEETVTMQVPEKQVGTPGISYVYLWIVPANASGTWQWKLPNGQTLDATVRQTFQNVDVRGTLVGAKPINVTLATLRGEDIRISALVEVGARTLRHDFVGRVRGDAIEGTVRVYDKTESSTPWSALRTGGRAASLEPQAPPR